MSVNFNVRYLGGPLLAALRRDPSLTGPICDGDVDFDPVEYERKFFQDTPSRVLDRAPGAMSRLRERFETLRARILARQEELLRSLDESGIASSDLGPALRIGRSWWAMESMIHSTVGRRLIAEEEGEAIGDDVGYGPARLLSPVELGAIVPELEVVTRNEAEHRFRVYEAEEYANQRKIGNASPHACSDEDFDDWSWRPFCELRAFVRTTAERPAWLLKWYD